MVNNEKSNYKNLCLKALKKAKCRITKQRIAVIEVLAKNNDPVSVPELYEKIKNENLDKVSVYRVINTLSELNLVHQVAPNGKYIACTHLSCTSDYHVISRCLVCSKTMESDIPKSKVKSLLKHMEEIQDFSPNAHVLHIDGTCSSCK